MTAHQIFVLLICQLLLLMLPAFGAFKLFQKAGEPGWKAFVPFYNTAVMLRLAGRPVHWAWWQVIPVVGWFITMSIYIEFVKAFARFSLLDHAFAALLPVIYFPWLAASKDCKYVGPEGVRKYKKTAVREWVDAAVFAIIAATLIRTFVFEAYEIPTPSMEKTLLVNDFLFVSKFSYGPRIPNTPIAMPFVHNTMPVTDGKSYVEWIHLPYSRWFPSPVKRMDVVVFNFPAGDTVINKPEYQSEQPYYDVARMLGGGNMDVGRQKIMDDPDSYPLITRPVDKQENYIKRCTGIAGDSLQIINQVVYINGKAEPLPPFSQNYYTIITGGQPLDETVMKEEYDIDLSNGDEFQQTGVPNRYRLLMTELARNRMIKNGLASKIIPELDNSQNVYPYNAAFPWTKDNYGPIWIPKKGASLALTPANYIVYERAIRDYEHNKLEMRDGKVYLNGNVAASYTFKMDYYWMMGDNRHQSQDSRYWGFVPEDHVVGQAWLIWMSWNHGVRWSRLFNRIR